VWSKNVSLACSTAGATIYYQIQALGTPYNPASWITYAGGGALFTVWMVNLFGVSTPKSVYAYATHSGLTDSPVVRMDYWYEPSGWGPGTYPP
jgi:hypothetical protein